MPLGICYTLRVIPVFITVVLAISAPASSITPDWKIGVDSSPFASAEEASVSEATVDWSAAASREQDACTTSHAAIELRTFLARLLGIQEPDTGFVIVAPGEALPGHAIILSTLSDARANPELAKIVAAMRLESQLQQPGSFAVIPAIDRLYIIGAGRTGVLYGVYDFLESVGIRWYGPEPHEEVVPHLPVIPLPETPGVQTPAFATRGFWVRQDFGNEPFYHWMARNRLNFWSIAEPNRALLHKLGIQLTYGGHQHFEQFMNPQDPYPYNHLLYPGDDDRPPDPYPVNPDSYKGDANKDGVLSYFEARPEWYGLIDGARTPFEGHLKTANICTSNPAAMDHLYASIVRELSAGDWRDVASLNFWPVDMGQWCECESCDPLGTPTDRLVLMVHGLDKALDAARKVGVIQRDVKVIFPIYLETLPAPTRPLPEDFDYSSIIGTFFPIQRCYVHSIDDPACTEYNTDHWRTFLDWTESEPRHYQGELFVGEYFNVSVNKSLPVIYPGIIATDVPKYHARGVRHMHYMHTDTRLLGLKRINNYLWGQFLWDTESDLPELMRDYLTALYGPVSAPMEELYERLEYALSNIKQLRYWNHLPERISEGLDPLFHTEHFQLEESHPPRNDGVDLSQSLSALARCREIMDLLLAMELPALLQRRLLADDRNLRYGENTAFFYDAVARAVLAERNGDSALARREFIRSLPFARALKGEREVVRTATNHHVHAEDGLEATRIEEAYKELGERLFPDFKL